MSVTEIKQATKENQNDRTISAVVEDPNFKEEIRVEGFKRGFNSVSAAANKILELGYKEFLMLPIKDSRNIADA